MSIFRHLSFFFRILQFIPYLIVSLFDLTEVRGLFCGRNVRSDNKIIMKYDVI